MIQIAVVDFAKFEGSTLVRLHCKICGTIIGEMMARPMERGQTPDGRIVERFVERFCRLSNYCEMKIVYEDGSAHITNGCVSCLTKIKFDEFDLQRLTEVDEIDLGLPHRNGAPIGIMQIKPGGGII